MSDNNKTASQPNKEPSRRGIDILHDPLLNKGTAFTEAERDALNIRGLLPPRVLTQKEQLSRVLGNFRRKSSDLEKYIFMVALQDRNECLYYRTVIDNLSEMLPIIYTPTVGEACRLFGHIFHPSRCLPVMLDVGGNNETLLGDPLYTGLPQRRLRGPDYEGLVDEFLMAVQERYPGVLVQFEDFATDNALRLLERYRDRICTFNDDIQGTAAVVLAGLLSACRIVGRPLKSQKILFYAGAAAGIANLIVSAMQAEGYPWNRLGPTAGSSIPRGLLSKAATIWQKRLMMKALPDHVRPSIVARLLWEPLWLTMWFWAITSA